MPTACVRWVYSALSCLLSGQRRLRIRVSQSCALPSPFTPVYEVENGQGLLQTRTGDKRVNLTPS